MDEPSSHGGSMDEPSSHWGLGVDLGRFPPIDAFIGYGSGVFRQVGYSGARPMVDLVFVIGEEAATSWHEDNLARHPEHYSRAMRSLGSSAVARVQRAGPGLYYNPHVRLPSEGGGELEAKYGVIGADDLLRDLRDWDSLYIAGRMHKPCLLQPCGGDRKLHASISAAAAANRRAALAAAVLLAGQGVGPGVVASGAGELGLLPLLSAVVRLSFDGDVRVGLAEDPQKVSNIVHGQQRDLWDIYAPIAQDLGVELRSPAGGPSLADTTAHFDATTAGRQRLFGELPVRLQDRVASRGGGRLAPWDDAAALRGELRATVRRSSLVQTAKGALTAGAARGFRYALQKLRKRLK